MQYFCKKPEEYMMQQLRLIPEQSGMIPWALVMYILDDVESVIIGLSVQMRRRFYVGTVNGLTSITRLGVLKM